MRYSSYWRFLAELQIPHNSDNSPTLASMESNVLVVSCTASVHDRPKELTSEVRFAKILGRMATLVETVGVDPDIKGSLGTREQGYFVRM